MRNESYMWKSRISFFFSFVYTLFLFHFLYIYVMYLPVLTYSFTTTLIFLFLQISLFWGYCSIHQLLYNFDFWILKKTLIGTLLEHQFLSTFSPKMEFGSTPANELYFAVSIAIEQCSTFRQIKDSPNLEKNIFAVSLVYAVHYILIENLLSS